MEHFGTIWCFTEWTVCLSLDGVHFCCGHGGPFSGAQPERRLRAPKSSTWHPLDCSSHHVLQRAGLWFKEHDEGIHNSVITLGALTLHPILLLWWGKTSALKVLKNLRNFLLLEFLGLEDNWNEIVLMFLCECRANRGDGSWQILSGHVGKFWSDGGKPGSFVKLMGFARWGQMDNWTCGWLHTYLILIAVTGPHKYN